MDHDEKIPPSFSSTSLSDYITSDEIILSYVFVLQGYMNMDMDISPEGREGREGKGRGRDA